MKWTLLSLAIFLSVESSAFGALMLQINSLTSDELSFSISGTFDADVIGDQKVFLALKNDYENNVGTNVDWIADIGLSLNFTQLPGSGVAVVENSISFNGAPVSALDSFLDAGSDWGDSIFFSAGSDIVAGTTVAGTVTLQRSGLFDPSANNLQLASGFINNSLSWARLEASASTDVVPEPATFAVWSILGTCFVGAGYFRRKRKAA